MKIPLSLTIAIPAYNEASSVEKVIKKSIQTAPKFAKNYEILLVDDGSTDKTGSIMDANAARNNRVNVIHHAKNQGFSGAIKTCYRKSAGDVIFLVPGDGQIDVSDLRIFWAALPGADVVVGYRIRNPEPFARKLNSMVFHFLYRTLFGVRLKEISTSILWRKIVLDDLDITAIPGSALIEPEVVYKAWAKGYRFAQVPIPYYPRTGDKPKGSNPLMIAITFKELLRLWWQMRVVPRVSV